MWLKALKQDNVSNRSNTLVSVFRFICLRYVIHHLLWLQASISLLSKLLIMKKLEFEDQIMKSKASYRSPIFTVHPRSISCSSYFLCTVCFISSERINMTISASIYAFSTTIKSFILSTMSQNLIFFRKVKKSIILKSHSHSSAHWALRHLLKCVHLIFSQGRTTIPVNPTFLSS